MAGKGRGWHDDSRRHSLSRKGIKTAKGNTRMKANNSKTIKINMWRGLLEDVENLPKNWDYEIIDLDTDDLDELREREELLDTKVSKNIMRIVIKNGVVWDVKNIPKGLDYEEIHDDS